LLAPWHPLFVLRGRDPACRFVATGIYRSHTPTKSSLTGGSLIGHDFRNLDGPHPCVVPELVLCGSAARWRQVALNARASGSVTASALAALFSPKRQFE
jgi:hypothetical protein